jgi:hypothetical protein
MVCKFFLYIMPKRNLYSGCLKRKIVCISFRLMEWGVGGRGVNKNY